MNIKFSSILFSFIFIFQISLTSVTFAIDSEKGQPTFEITLIEEKLLDSHILRTYRLNDGSLRTTDILIPDELLPLIYESENPLLEAKKLLHHQYTILELRKRAEEIINEYNPNFSENAMLTLSNEIKDTFEKEYKIIQIYTNNQIQNGNTIPILKEEINDYNIIVNTGPRLIEPVEALYPPINWPFIIAVIAGGLILLSLLLFFIKRRSRS